ncbi:MAG: hypothetical protein ACRERE_37225 [Candidatus Entotheonellia bacterium]
MLETDLTREEIVQRVVRGLKRPNFPSFLLEVPPGCNYPDIIIEVYQEFSKNRPEKTLCAQMTIDQFPNEQALVDDLIRQWINRDGELNERWKEELDFAEDSAVPQRLIRFANFIASLRLRLVAFFKRFDHVFRSMSSELLAAMRDLEHASRLACVNASPLSYEELYLRRAREDPTFTSDYGQVHNRLSVGLHSRDSALKIWRERFDLPVDDRISLAYFETAYKESGGLPAAFELAANAITDPTSLDPDIRFYRSELAKILPNAFTHLLRYDEKDRSNKLVEAIARIHVGTEYTTDYGLIKNHRWGSLFLYESEGDTHLSCDALGRMALAMIRSQRAASRVGPETLYEQGEYLACCQALKQSGVPSIPVLAKAAEMLAEVFEDSPRNLYFGPNVRWKRVKALAEEAAKLCSDEASRKEFEAWYRIAEVHSTLPKPDRAQIEDYLKKQQVAGVRGVEEAAIYLGVRMLAVARDPNTLTAAHTAIPLLEDILRHYIVLVLNLPLNGSAFANVDEVSIAQWWVNKTPFKRPDPLERLGGTQLAVLAATISAQRNTPFFDSQSDLNLILSDQDTIRNLLGHYATTPREDMSKRLIQSAKALLERMCKHGGCSITLNEIERQVEPPRSFLDS